MEDGGPGACIPLPRPRLSPRLSKSDPLERFAGQTKPFLRMILVHTIPCIPSCIFDYFSVLIHRANEHQRRESINVTLNSLDP